MSLKSGKGILVAAAFISVACLVQGIHIQLLLAASVLLYLLFRVNPSLPWYLIELVMIMFTLMLKRGALITSGSAYAHSGTWHGLGSPANLMGPANEFMLFYLMAWAEECRLDGNWTAHWITIPVSLFAVIYPEGGISLLPFVILGVVAGELIHRLKRAEKITSLVSSISGKREKQTQEHPFFPMIPARGDTEIFDGEDSLASALLDAAGRINRKTSGPGSIKRTVYGFISDAMTIFNFDAAGFWVFEDDGSLSFFMSRVRGSGDEHRIRMESEGQNNLSSLLPSMETCLKNGPESAQFAELRIGETGDLWFIPIVEGDRRIGVFQAETQGQIDPAAMTLLRGLLGHLSVGILNLRLAEGVSKISSELAQREFDFATLNLFSRIAGRSEDLDRILDLSVELLMRVATFPAAGVVVIRDGQIGIRRFRGSGDIPELLEKLFIENWPFAIPDPGVFADIDLPISDAHDALTGFRAVGCCQKVKGGETALFLIPCEAGQPNSRQRNFMDMLLRQVASVLETMTTLSGLEKKVRLLRLIYAVCDSIAGTSSMGDRMSSISEVLREFLGVDGCAIVIPDGVGRVIPYPSRGMETIVENPDFSSELLFSDPVKSPDMVKDIPGGVFQFRCGPGMEAIQAVRLVYGEEAMGYLVIRGGGSLFDMLERDFEVVRAVGVLTGLIAATYRMHSQVARLKGFLHSVLDSVKEAILVVDSSGRIAAINAPARGMFSLFGSRGRFRSFSGGHFFPETDQFSDQFIDLSELLDEHPAIGEMVLENGQPAWNRFGGIGDGGLDRIVESRGQILDIHADAMEFSDRGRCMILTMRDITERQKMEGELKRIERLAALGEMAAGIAHEIRNPLGGMKVITSFLLSSFDEEDERRDMVETVISGIGDLNRKIGELLSFARPESPAMEVVNLHEVLNHSLEVYRAEAEDLGITIDYRGHCQCNRQSDGSEGELQEIECSGNHSMAGETESVEVPVMVWTDQGKLSQVIGNIVRNSFQAMGRGGIIRIWIQPCENQVNLIIADNGPGMNGETLARAMNPFFTTKADGTGLGLAISSKIMESMEAGIAIESAEGEGASVVLTLPRTDVENGKSHAGGEVSE
ncbi:MAG: hypothetical protein CVV64_06800 [Candidatus Wallbacteria bacterium HGW-Wallbacteria-1]|jgi:signal transduction histidine kinase|uniref:histidine kinase n=1 Tax=Candidatus Wallbacteria bacterium HGW-Wallbacteria-1 TaxID=2013854 RepID=A0A2N1PSY6_9BACT|nr:MAG: hypothetical protein CVV64_06800 [Candidatus Wallbacteria bacterium HGW-Wallbacteria-1]